MKLLPGPRVPTIFGGSIQLPDLEGPPLALPKGPSGRSLRLLGQSVGEELSWVIRILPVAGGFIGDALEDMHHAEIRKGMTSEEYDRFIQHDKALPTTLAVARTIMFEG